MNRGVGAVVGTLVVAALMVTSAFALPMLGGGVAPFDGATDADEPDDSDPLASGPGVDDGDADADAGELVSMEPASSDTAPDASLAQEHDDAVEDGVEEGIELAQSQGVEVSQEQRAAAVEGASASVAQHQDADVEQVQEATKGAVHGSVMQSQEVDVEQLQAAVGGATDGALAQHQTVTASQMQSATWGATHGALAQSQRVTVEGIQFATYGAAAGATAEAGEKDVEETPKIQEAAQGAAYGVLEQYQKITVEQRQQVTLEHVQHSAAGASAGALEGSTEVALEGDQRIEVEQHQRVDVKQVQKAAIGAAKGALVQRQEVTVEQTQAAARGAGKGSLKQVQTVDVEQVQRVSITAIQKASFGAAKGAIYQSQEATVEQIQYAADGAAGGTLVQHQEVSITQIQHAAVGASQGAIESAIQYQVVEVQQIQAAAFGSGEGAVLQKQVVDVTQVQKLAAGSASGVLAQHQEATVEQIQIVASSATQETARAVQYQRISVTQLQVLSQDTAADAIGYAIDEGTDDVVVISQHIEIEMEQRIEAIDELEGEASVAFADQESDGESVVVDDVDLSDGGFVAIYTGDGVADPAAVIGSSDYLEAGEHVDVEIDLDEPIESDQPLVAVVHHDTTGDGTFQYAESDGVDDEPYVTAAGAPVQDVAFVTVVDDEPEATLEVTDQEGDGETLTVEEASADVDYIVTAEYDGERVDSDEFEADQTETDLDIDLEPALEEETAVDVSVRAVDDDEALATETITYTLVDEPPEPDATLNVSDQTGDGETVTVEEASADVAYSLTVTDEDGEQRGESEVFEANETAAFEAIDLEPPLEENATLEVALESAADDADGELDDDAADADGVLASETIEYTVDGDPATFEAEFVTCQQAEVTGSFEDGDTIIVATAFYESGGFGNTMGEYAITVGEDLEAPFEGTITYETGDEFTVEETTDGPVVTVPEGDFGTAITGFASPDATPGEIDHPNPDGSECIEEIRPDLPEISVEETEPIDGDDATVGNESPGVGLLADVGAVQETEPTDDGIAVTFGYENPNDAELLVDSEFVEGTTDDEPVDVLEPGTNTFTVEWTPADDDERLVWAVDMSWYDYDEDAVEPAETATAGEIDPADPAEFAVEITDTNDPVEVGETLEVDAEIDNVGESEGTQELDLELDGESVDLEDVTLEPGATEALTLTADTDDLEAGDYAAVVSSENDSDEATITVEEPGEPEFAVTDLEAPETGEPGAAVTVSATIENVGDAAGSQTVSYDVDGQELETATVDLEAGSSTTLSFTSTLPETDSTHTVTTDDESVSATIEVLEPEAGADESEEDPTEPAGPPDDDPQEPPDDDTDDPVESPNEDETGEDGTGEGEADEDGTGEDEIDEEETGEDETDEDGADELPVHEPPAV